jgi:hypothetical protein
MENIEMRTGDRSEDTTAWLIRSGISPNIFSNSLMASDRFPSGREVVPHK